MSTDEVPVLWHIKVSNFNEKARWALDYKRIPHIRRDPMPGAHAFVALALTRRVVTFPVLRIDGRTIGDSTRIIATLEQRVPEPRLYPYDPASHRVALALEEFFDENLGHDVRRVVFWELLQHPELMRARAAKTMSRRQGRALASALPVFRAMLLRRYGITEHSAAQSLLKVRAAMRLMEEVLDAREHLVGDEFTVADLTAAALLAPLLAPAELPYGGSSTTFPSRLAEIAAELRSLPAGQWILRTYERYRPESAEIGQA
jgi:glutathione S-transferase